MNNKQREDMEYNDIQKSQREHVNLFIEGNGKAFYHNISIDIVIFGYHERTLKVLLQKPHFSDKWMLTGGFIKRTESVEMAAERIVSNRTQLKNLPIYQFYTFSKPGRDKSDKEAQRKDFEFAGFKVPENFWMFDQFITVGCFAFTEYSKVKPSGEYNTEDCQWFDIDNLPELMYDHEEIVSLAVKYLPIFANYCPIGYSLLPEKFTLPEIQSLYETMLNKKLDSRNFAKRLTSLGIIIKLDEQRKIGAHRSPYLYKFNKERYDEVIKDVSSIII